MRNSAPVTIAPTGTISIIAGASSGIEPLFAISYVRNVMDGTRLVEGNAFFEAVARREGFYSAELMERLAETGSLAGAPEVPGWARDLFRVSHEIDPEWHVRMQAAFQEHTDNAVSKTINMPAAARPEDIAAAYRQAWELGCKGITVYRDGSRGGQVLSAGGAAPRLPRPRPRPTLRPPHPRPRIRRLRRRARAGGAGYADAARAAPAHLRLYGTGAHRTRQYVRDRELRPGRRYAL